MKSVEINFNKKEKETLMRTVMLEVEKAVNELNIEIGILQNECQLQIENARNN